MRSPTTLTRSGSITFEEFCDPVSEDQKADLIDGVISVAPPEGPAVSLLFVWLLQIVDQFVEANDLGQVFGSRVAFRVGPKNGPEPDIAFVSHDRLRLAQQGFFNGPPDLAIEIVSPESVERDYVKKRAVYEKAGVLEYWIIDRDLRKVTLLRLGRAKRYREIRPARGVLRSEAVRGFWLKSAWLWEQPRTSAGKVLKQILRQEAN